MGEFRLQPLRIPSGWRVEYNNFSEYDPLNDDPEKLCELCEDMLMLENDCLMIDLGWYPEMELNGRFILILADKKRERPFEQPIARFESRSREEIIETVERWMLTERTDIT